MCIYFLWHTIHNNTSLKTKECNRRALAIPKCFLRNILEEQKNKIYIAYFIINNQIIFFNLQLWNLFVSNVKKVYMLQPFIIQNNSLHYLHQPQCFIILRENAAFCYSALQTAQSSFWKWPAFSFVRRRACNTCWWTHIRLQTRSHTLCLPQTHFSCCSSLRSESDTAECQLHWQAYARQPFFLLSLAFSL